MEVLLPTDTCLYTDSPCIYLMSKVGTGRHLAEALSRLLISLAALERGTHQDGHDLDVCFLPSRVSATR